MQEQWRGKNQAVDAIDYPAVARDRGPHVFDAEVAFDPFHVIRLGQRAVDQVRRDEWTPTNAPKLRPISGSRTRAGRY